MKIYKFIQHAHHIVDYPNGKTEGLYIWLQVTGDLPPTNWLWECPLLKPV